MPNLTDYLPKDKEAKINSSQETVIKDLVAKWKSNSEPKDFFYQVLGLENKYHLTAGEIKEKINLTYRAALREWHPDSDKRRARNLEEQKLSADFLKLLKEAHETLTDEDKKKAYDKIIFGPQEQNESETKSSPAASTAFSSTNPSASWYDFRPGTKPRSARTAAFSSNPSAYWYDFRFDTKPKPATSTSSSSSKPDTYWSETKPRATASNASSDPNNHSETKLTPLSLLSLVTYLQGVDKLYPPKSISPVLLNSLIKKITDVSENFSDDSWLPISHVVNLINELAAVLDADTEYKNWGAPKPKDYKDYLSLVLKAAAIKLLPEQFRHWVQPLFGPHVVFSDQTHKGYFYHHDDGIHFASSVWGEPFFQMASMSLDDLLNHKAQRGTFYAAPRPEQLLWATNSTIGSLVHEAIIHYKKKPHVLHKILEVCPMDKFNVNSVDKNGNSYLHLLVLENMDKETFHLVLNKIPFHPCRMTNKAGFTPYQLARKNKNFDLSLLIRIAPDVETLLNEYLALTDQKDIDWFANRVLLPYCNARADSALSRMDELQRKVSSYILDGQAHQKGLTWRHVAVLFSGKMMPRLDQRHATQRHQLIQFYQTVFANLADIDRRFIYYQWLSISPTDVGAAYIIAYCLTDQCYAYCKHEFSAAQKKDVINYFISKGHSDLLKTIMEQEPDLTFAELVEENGTTIRSVIDTICKGSSEVATLSDETIGIISRHPHFKLTNVDVLQLINSKRSYELIGFLCNGVTIGQDIRWAAAAAIAKTEGSDHVTLEQMNTAFTLNDISVFIKTQVSPSLLAQLNTDLYAAKYTVVHQQVNMRVFLNFLLVYVDQRLENEPAQREQLLINIQTFLQTKGLRMEWEPAPKPAPAVESVSNTGALRLFVPASQPVVLSAIEEKRMAYLEFLKDDHSPTAGLNKKILKQEADLGELDDADVTTLVSAFMVSNVPLCTKLMQQLIPVTEEVFFIAILSQHAEAIKLVMKLYQPSFHSCVVKALASCNEAINTLVHSYLGSDASDHTKRLNEIIADDNNSQAKKSKSR